MTTPAYTIIPDTSIDADSLTDVALMTALRDNPLAIGGGGSGAPPIALTASATAVTKTVGDNSTAPATTAYCENFVNNDNGAGGVGSYALVSSGTTVASGATTAGSNLDYVSLSSDLTTTSTSTALSGTWRNVAQNVSTSFPIGLFQRIS